METEENTVNNYETEEPEPMKVSEPAVLYGSNCVLDLDETKRYTYADYLTWWDDKRRELINGFIHMMSPAAHTKHAIISHKLVCDIGYFIKKRKGKRKLFDAPFDVRLPNKKVETADDKVYTVVQPDICLICDLSKLDKRGCIGTPDLVIEIASKSNWKYDSGKTYESEGKVPVRALKGLEIDLEELFGEFKNSHY